jgi:hypothetical protein
MAAWHTLLAAVVRGGVAVGLLAEEKVGWAALVLGDVI